MNRSAPPASSVASQSKASLPSHLKDLGDERFAHRALVAVEFDDPQHLPQIVRMGGQLLMRSL